MAALSIACTSASADVYKGNGFSFDIPELSLQDVQDSVASTLALIGEPDAIRKLPHPYWQTTPCYILPSPERGSGAALKSIFAQIDERLGLKIAPCGPSPGPAMNYFEAEGTVDSAGRDVLRKLDGNAKVLPTQLAHFADGKTGCAYDIAATKHGPRDVTIIAGVVAIDRHRMGFNDEKCLFLGTVAVLGLGNPVVFTGLEMKYGQIDWQTQVEVNLIALFVLNLMVESDRGWHSDEMDAKVRHIIWTMHELGKS